MLDAASALLGICRERTYDGEPAMKLEAAAVGGTVEAWEPVFSDVDWCECLSTRAILKTALSRLSCAPEGDRHAVRDIAASVQYNLARGIAALAIHAAERDDIPLVALSGGVVATGPYGRPSVRRSPGPGYPCHQRCVPARRRVRLLRPVRLGGNAPYGSTKKVASSGMTSKNKHFILTHVQR